MILRRMPVLCLSVVLPLAVPLVLALGGCVPKKNLPPDEIQKLTKLDDVMAVQATVADPHWRQIGQQTFTEDELTALTDVGERLQVTALKSKEFSKGAGFDALATQLHARAADLSTAARAKDAAGVSKALTEMKATCKECHSKFR